MDKTEGIISKIKVLVVEDDEASAKLLLANLQKYVGEILVASTGEDAIDLYKQNPDTDLILMDLQLPNLDGYAATKAIINLNKNVVVFAQSAYAQIENKAKAFESGCNEYITKPIDRNELKLLLRKYFNNRVEE